jgi:hypothetical protein
MLPNAHPQANAGQHSVHAAVEKPAIMTKTCLNCTPPLLPEDNFCSRCGQSTKTKRLGFRELRKDIAQEMLHADNSLIRLTIDLARKPGLTAAAYIAGKRKAYYEPLKYLSLAVGISVFLNAYFDLMSSGGSDQNPVSAFVSRHIDLVFFASVPIAEAFSWLFFRQKGYNYTEHLALHAFWGGFRTVFFLLIFTPLVVLFRQYYSLILMIYFAAWTAYVTWANVQVMGQRLWLTALKSILIILLTQVVISLVIAVGAIAYFRFWG